MPNIMDAHAQTDLGPVGKGAIEKRPPKQGLFLVAVGLRLHKASCRNKGQRCTFQEGTKGTYVIIKEQLFNFCEPKVFMKLEYFPNF